MKTIRSLVTLLILGAAATVVTAVEKPKTNVQSVNENQFLVAIETPEASAMEVTINDGNGDIVYYKQSNKANTSYKKIFDVRNLENGEYSIELKTKGMISKRDLVIADDRIYVGKADKAQLIAPYIGLDNEKLVFTHLNFENEKYQLGIYGETGLVYEGTLENASPINAGFDVSKLKAGKYEVILHSDTREFSYSFSR